MFKYLSRFDYSILTLFIVFFGLLINLFVAVFRPALEESLIIANRDNWSRFMIGKYHNIRSIDHYDDTQIQL